MKILFFAWKDNGHPGAGGAEVVLHELVKRLVSDGHQVTILTAAYGAAPARDTIDGATVIRVGKNRYLHSLQALWYYWRHLRNRFDVIVETVNTAPYMHVFAGDKARSFLLYHQLAREIWFEESFPPVSHIGYWLLEPLATWLLGKSKAQTITVSESTKQDLLRFGFRSERIHIISEGIPIDPVSDLQATQKFSQPTLLSHGTLRAMKRTLDQVKAFEIAKQEIPSLQLKISGSNNDAYGKQVMDYIVQSPYRTDIEYCGRTTDEQKVQLMQQCHAIVVTSSKEGWGIIVTEANSQGSPAIVYDVDGLRDSVRHNKTGIITDATPEALAAGIVQTLHNTEKYQALRQAAWRWSKHITFDQSYKDFKAIIGA